MYDFCDFLFRDIFLQEKIRQSTFMFVILTLNYLAGNVLAVVVAVWEQLDVKIPRTKPVYHLLIDAISVCTVLFAMVPNRVAVDSHY
jgi:hypothetical protein